MGHIKPHPVVAYKKHFFIALVFHSELNPGRGMLTRNLPGVVQQVRQCDAQQILISDHTKSRCYLKLHLTLWLCLFEFCSDDFRDSAQIDLIGEDFVASKTREIQ